MQKFVPQSCVGIFRNDAPDPHHWTLNSCFGVFLFVWVHLGPFPYSTKLAAKHAKLVKVMQKFVPQSRVRVFHNNTPDSYHWTLNSCFGAFLSIWVHLEPFCYYTKLAAKHAKLVQLMKKFVPRSRVRIFRNDTPDPHQWTLNSCFGAFLSIWVHLGLFHYYTKTRETSAINAKLRAVMSC